MLAGCAQELTETQVGNADVAFPVLRGIAENDGTKAAIANSGAFTWTAGDAAAVFNAAGDAMSEYVAATGGADDVAFNYSSGTSLTPYIGVYPYDIVDSPASFDGTDITVLLPDEYPGLSSSEAMLALVPMLAKADGSNLYFKHLGGMLKLDLGTVAAGVTGFCIETPGKRINGVYTVSVAGVNPEIAVEDSTDPAEEIIMISYASALASPKTETLYIPLPTGSYGGLTVYIYNEHDVVGQFSVGAFTITRRKMAYTTHFKVEDIVTVPAGGGTISIPEKEDGVALDFTAVTNGSDSYSLEYEGSTKPRKVYITGESGTATVGDLSGDLSSSTVEILAGDYASTSIKTAASTLVIRENAYVETVNIPQGNAVIEGEVDFVNINAAVNVTVSAPTPCVITVNDAATLNISSPASVELATGSSGSTVTAEGADIDLSVSSAEPGFVADVRANDGGTVTVMGAGANVTLNTSDDGEPGSEVIQATCYTRITSYDQLTVGSKVIAVTYTGGGMLYSRASAMGIGAVDCEYIEAVDEWTGFDFTDADHNIVAVLPGSGVEEFTLAKQSINIEGDDLEAMSMLGTNGYLYADSENDNTLSIKPVTSYDTAWTLYLFEDSQLMTFGNYGSIYFGEHFVATDGGSPLWLYKLDGSGTAEKIFTTYTVTYDGNGATGGEAPAAEVWLKNDVGPDLLPNANTLYKTGHMFSGWNTQADGSGTGYDADVPIDPQIELTGDLTLYAQWESGAHEITVNYNNGSLGTINLNPGSWVTDGTTVTVYPNKANSNVILTGLTYTPEGGVSVDILSDKTFVMPDCDVTVDVTWVQGYMLTVTKSGVGTSVCNVLVDPDDNAYDAWNYLIPAGETVTISWSKALDSYNYMLGSLTWTPEGGAATDIFSTKTFTMPANNVTVAATFVSSQVVFDLTTTSNRSSGTNSLIWNYSPANTYVTMNLAVGSAVGYNAGWQSYPNNDYLYTKVWDGFLLTVTPASGHSIAKVELAGTGNLSIKSSTNTASSIGREYTLDDGTQPIVLTMGQECGISTVTVTMEY